MDTYQQKFCEFLMESGIMEIGGIERRKRHGIILELSRISPFVFDLDQLKSDLTLRQLGEFCAEALYDHFGTDVDVLFVPEGEDCAMAAATAVAFRDKYDRLIDYATSCKRQTKHGRYRHAIVGHQPAAGERVVTFKVTAISGKPFADAMQVLQAQPGVKVLGALVVFDRMEVSDSGDMTKTTLQEVSDKYCMEARSVVSAKHLAEYLRRSKRITAVQMSDIISYYFRFGPAGIMDNWKPR